jgi:hypothetical protein
VAGAWSRGEDRRQVGAASGVGEGQDLVPGAQGGGATHRNEFLNPTGLGWLAGNVAGAPPGRAVGAACMSPPEP